MSAMDFLEQANVLYRKCHDNGHVLSTEDRASLSLSISKMIKKCLIQQGGVASFKHAPFVTVVKLTVAAGCFEGERAASGFLSLEKYFLHLASHPWKREFWLLKMYGGFFCTKVKAHLKSPEQILFLVGYVKPDGNGAGPGAADDTTLVLEKAPNADQALAVAFDCQVAAVMCRQIGEYYEKMKCVQLTLVDAMNVILSGTSNDAVAVSSPVPPLHVTPVVSTAACEMYAMSGGRIVPNDVRGVGANYLHQGMMVNNYGNQVVAPGYVRDGANVGLSLPRHTIPAAGGMGLGVVGAARAPPEIMGAQGKVLGSRHDYLAPIPNSAPYTDSTESHVTGALRTNVGVGGPASRQPSMASSATGSKFSSSGYGSAPASTFSASSSAYAASSGYGSASQTSTQHYNANTYANTYATGGRIVDQVDYGAVATNEAVGSRHSRPHPLPQQTPPAFPYIDEDQPELATPFPEGTHEEHLMESIRTVHNMNTTQGAGRSQYPAKMASASAVLGDRRETPVHGGTVDGVQVPVSYDDWNWFRNQQVEGPPPAYNAVVGTAGARAAQTTVTSQNVPLCYPTDRARHPPQPATAVTAMLNPNHMMDMKRHVAGMDGRHQRTGSGDYPPLTVVGEGRQATGPLSESVLSRDRRGDGGLAPSNLMLDGSQQVQVQQPIYHPPSTDPRYQRHTTVVARPTMQQQQQQQPTFAEMAGGKPDQSSLLARQPFGGPVLNNLDKVHHGKTLNVHSLPQGSGSASAVVMREKVSSASNLRASSLVTPSRRHTDVSGDGLSRHASRSMDMGSLRWKCRACTMENSSANTICVACSKSRDAPDLQTPAGESKRVCPHCTLENAPGLVECDACGNLLPQEVHTFV